MTATTTEPGAVGHGQPLLSVRGITKDFPGLRALDDVSLDVGSGEIVAVVGHNGSGKSTLVKILARVHTADAGTVDLAGPAGDGDGMQEDPAELHIIHQDLGLVSELTTVENLGITPRGRRADWGRVHHAAEQEHAKELVSRFGEPFDVTVPIARLAPAQRSVIAIARALDGWSHPRNVLILDEPTEALHATETEILFDAVRRVARDGAGVIFISHRLDEVLSLADRVVVLRNGTKVADVATRGLDHGRLIEYVTGSDAESMEAPRRNSASGQTVLDVRGLAGQDVHDVDLTVRAGEVVGVAGVLGSGRESVPSLLFGAAPATAESYTVDGEPYTSRSPRASVRRGLAFVAGDRRRFGGVGLMNARENMTLPELGSLTGAWGQLRQRAENDLAESLVRRYDVKPALTERHFAQFSGGNQQKIVFAKWLRNEPRVLILEEPTQGVDVGAKQAIYAEVDAAAERGVAVVVCSSDAKELVRLCDRVLVIREGRIEAKLSGDELNENMLVNRSYGFGAVHPPVTGGTAGPVVGATGEQES
ncbi:sugar ABC transporter ATP-binding protein [Kocuria sp. M1N1S27]|uniref:sugar ABC transporter ATP-binding protein n=1 Tax=Kocuria kalidii TaxID=3376283 RepID=UPI0037BB823C